MTPAEMVREFREAFGLPIAESPRIPAPDLVELRIALVAEEVRELQAAIDSGDMHAVAQEAADVVYVAYGSALTFGLPTDGWSRRVFLLGGLQREFESFREEAWRGHLPLILSALQSVAAEAYAIADRFGIRDLDVVIAEVHRANMAKRHPDGTVRRRVDGKVLKPSGWVGPDIAAVLNRPAVAS